MAHPARVVLFDAVGTLLAPWPPVGEAYCLVASRFGLQCDEPTVRMAFRRAFAAQEALDRAAGHRTSRPRERDRWRAIVREVFPAAADEEALFEALWHHFALPGSWRLFDEVPSTLAELARAGWRLGVASNFDERLLPLCQQLLPSVAAENVFASSELGCRKPAGEFFAEIARRLRAQPGEIVLVGDDWENDIRGALAAGWQAWGVDRDSPDRRPGFLTSLAELPAKLGTTR